MRRRGAVERITEKNLAGQHWKSQTTSAGVELLPPSGVACGNEFPADGREVGFKMVYMDAVPDGFGLDNTPKTVEKIKKVLSDCKTIMCEDHTHPLDELIADGPEDEADSAPFGSAASEVRPGSEVLL